LLPVCLLAVKVKLRKRAFPFSLLDLPVKFLSLFKTVKVLFLHSCAIHALSFTNGFLLGLCNEGVEICPGLLNTRGFGFRSGMSCSVAIVAAVLRVVMYLFV